MADIALEHAPQHPTAQLSPSPPPPQPVPVALAPEVLDRLRQLQQADSPVSVNEILKAANLSHLAQPSPSKSLDGRISQMTVPHLQKSTSTLTLAERRRIPTSPEKLKVYAHMAAHTRTLSNDSSDSNNDRFRRLEAENAKLPPQDSEEYLLARLERQNALLNADPKSVCIESNRLKADFSTLRTLVSDNTFSPTRIEDTEALLNRSSIKHTLESTDYDVSDWDFWQCVVDDFPVAAAKLPHLLAAKLRYGGIPHRLRGVVWQAMARSSATNLESMYDSLVLEETQSPSPYERVIKRDLSRTFPHIEMFKADGGEGQQAMGRLLKAYSVYDAHVGYCQGLAFLVGPLLMVMPEKQAFCVFVRLMETYDMRTMFTLNMEGLHLRLHQFQTLLSQRCPRLDAHLTQHSIHPAMYASQWYLTLFAYSLPLPLVLRIYDLALAEGAVETITRVAIALMVKNEEHLLDIDDFEELMIYLSSRKLYEEAYDVNIDTVIADTMSLSALISKAKMDSIAETHDRELAQEKDRAHQVLAVRFGGWGANKSKNSNNNNGYNSEKKSSGRRESWFNWGNDSAAGPTPIPTPTTPTISQVTSSFPCSPVMQRHLSSPNIPVSAVAAAATEKPQDRTVPLLHQQIEDLVVALSQLQKEHSVLSEDLMTVKMREMDQEAEHAQVLKLNDTLVRRVKKYKAKLAMAKLPEHHQHQNQNQNQMMSPVDTPTSVFDPVYQARIEEVARLQELEQDGQFRSFVESLRLTGDFGALIAGALSVDPNDPNIMNQKNILENHADLDDQGQQTKRHSAASTRSSLGSQGSRCASSDDTAATTVADDMSDNETEKEDEEVEVNEKNLRDNHNRISRVQSGTHISRHEESEIKQRSHTEEEDSMMRNVTAELVSFKLANFEMGQKYEHLCHTYEECKQKLQVAQDGQRSMVEKVMDLQNEVEAHQIDKEELYAERDELIKENEELAELTAVAKKTSTELQVEKLSLAKDVEALERRVKELEEEKREYLMPRGSFTEEVFAAHRTLFKTQDDSAAGNSGSSSNSSSLANQPSRRHTLQMGWNNDHNTNNNGQNGEYQKMYIESELRCRELEKLLAEAKFKIVEHETSTVGPISPRASFQQRRASSVQIKRNSAASLSMLAYRGSSPTSPREFGMGGNHERTHSNSFSIVEPSRASSDSMTSTHSTASHSSSPNSNNNSKKRSSVYSRLWTAFGTSANGSPASSVGLKSPIEESSGCLYEEPERA